MVDAEKEIPYVRHDPTRGPVPVAEYSPAEFLMQLGEYSRMMNSAVKRLTKTSERLARANVKLTWLLLAIGVLQLATLLFQVLSSHAH